MVRTTVGDDDDDFDDFDDDEKKTTTTSSKWSKSSKSSSSFERRRSNDERHSSYYVVVEKDERILGKNPMPKNTPFFSLPETLNKRLKKKTKERKRGKLFSSERDKIQQTRTHTRKRKTLLCAWSLL